MFEDLNVKKISLFLVLIVAMISLLVVPEE